MKPLYLLIEGFAAKVIAGSNDTATFAPIIATFTRTITDKIGFLSGMFFSVMFVINISVLFADFLRLIPHKNIIAAIMLLILAILIQFRVGMPTPKEKCHEYLKKYDHHIKFLKALSLGFLTFLATAIDDVIAFSSILLKPFNDQILVVTGIIVAALLEFFIIFKFSHFIAKLKYTTELTIAGLFVLAILVAAGAI